MKNMRKENGITLVALTVTIVILLILANVSINFILGKNGLISKSKEASQKTKEAYAAEEKNANQLEDNIMQELTGTKFINGAPIPEGYYYVGGNRNKGVVISDSAEDKNKYENQDNVGNDLKGNQYVWVPVNNTSEFYKISSEGIELLGGTGVKTYKYSVSNYDIMTIPGKTGYREPDTVYYYDNDNTAKEAGFTSFNEMVLTIRNEYSEMIESMEKYKGFYVGRYELSDNGEKNGNPITNANWYQLYKKCKELNNIENIKSRMIGGMQWDAICRWLENCGYDVQNSEAWGNYKYDENGKRVVNETGKYEEYKANNIYDFAGNCTEWTQEASNVIHRTARDLEDSENKLQSVVNRIPHMAPIDNREDCGTRVMLILK